MKHRSYIPTVSDIEAILAGRKTRFSVPVKPQPSAESFSEMVDYYDEKPKRARFWTKREVGNPFIQDIKCPFTTGMLVYCREKWFPAAINADYVLIGYGDPDNVQTLEIQVEDEGPYWRSLERERLLSPATMPKEAARIILRVVSVKVERVQDITEEDAIKEGITEVPGYRFSHPIQGMTSMPRCCNIIIGNRLIEKPTARAVYAIVNQEKWNRNDWIFAVHFEVASTQGWDKIEMI